METFEFDIKLRVQVQAFDESDALDTVMDVYAVGENCGTTVTDCEYLESGKKKK
jgi:hypothetical protein